MVKIFNNLVQDLANRVKEECSLTLDVDKSIVELAISECDMVYGARPLRRFIERELTTAIAKMMLSGEKRMVSGQFLLTISGNVLRIARV